MRKLASRPGPEAPVNCRKGSAEQMGQKRYRQGEPTQKRGQKKPWKLPGIRTGGLTCLKKHQREPQSTGKDGGYGPWSSATVLTVRPIGHRGTRKIEGMERKKELVAAET